MEDIEIVCVIDDGGTRRCFSIAVDRNLMPVCHTTDTKPTNDIEWYNELFKQTAINPETEAVVIKDWSQVFETLITAFEGLEDYQPIHHADFISHHSDIEDSYIETLFENQLEHCSRFINQTVSEAGVCKNDIIELNNLGLL